MVQKTGKNGCDFVIFVIQLFAIISIITSLTKKRRKEHNIRPLAFEYFNSVMVGRELDLIKRGLIRKMKVQDQIPYYAKKDTDPPRNPQVSHARTQL